MLSEMKRNRELCLGTMDSWVLWNLTGGQTFACDLTNASRTHLLDIHRLVWGDDLLALFEIPKAALPQVRPSKSDFGRSVALGNLPAGIPILSMIGDSAFWVHWNIFKRFNKYAIGMG